MNFIFYERKLSEIVNDNTLVTKVDNDPTDQLKKDLNKIISRINRGNNSTRCNLLEGKFEISHICGNPKNTQKYDRPTFKTNNIASRNSNL